MRCVKTSELKGNEYLARQVFSKTQELLINEGIILSEKYIELLQNHGVEYVIIDDEYEKRKKSQAIRENIKKDIQNSVKDILEQHVYGNAKELEQLCTVAENLLKEVVEDDEMACQVAEIKDHSPDIYSHSVNVAILSSLLAMKDGFSQEIVKEVTTGCLLHDLGLRYVTLDYIGHDVGKFNFNDLKEIRNHVIYGYEVLENEDWISEVAKEIVLCHHERIDGRGYPFRYEGSQVKRTTQIVAVCDFFDRMICGMGSEKKTRGQAADAIRKNAGKAYEQSISDLFFNFVALYPVGSTVRLSKGEIATVEKQNPGNASYPVVSIVMDEQGNRIKPYLKDLNESKERTIVEIIK